MPQPAWWFSFGHGPGLAPVVGRLSPRASLEVQFKHSCEDGFVSYGGGFGVP